MKDGWIGEMYGWMKEQIDRQTDLDGLINIEARHSTISYRMPKPGS